MIHRSVLILGLGILVPISSVHADLPWSNIPSNYGVKRDFFTISTKTPPAVLYVEDSHGRRTGINPAYVSRLDKYGTLLDQKGFFCEIPLSSNDQQNNVSDETGLPKATTPTLIDILDGGNQVYTITLIGVTEGVQEVIVQDAPPTSNPHAPQNQFNVLLQAGETKKIKILVDTNTHSTSISRVVSSGDLLSDVKTACALGQVTSPLACKHLEMRAKLIEEALDEGHIKEAVAMIRVFLWSLGERGDEFLDQDDMDCHSFIKEPALDILKEDAKALLESLQKDGGHGHGDDGEGKSRRGDNRSFFDRLFGWL